MKKLLRAITTISVLMYHLIVVVRLIKLLINELNDLILSLTAHIEAITELIIKLNDLFLLLNG